MRYGYFDNANREYVIDRVDVPASWTNYIGTGDMYGVFNHTAGGYTVCGSSEHHRITRFRPNGVPADRPGHYVYIRDEDTGEYWSVSWQPVAKPKEYYSCRHGLGYSTYLSRYGGIDASETLFIAMDDPVELWDVRIANRTDRARHLTVCSYAEFSFHHVDMDNQNFQMSLYAAGSRYTDGIIEYDLHYENSGWQFFTSDFTPDGYDCLRDAFIGPYRTESDPLALETGRFSSSAGTGGNHVTVLAKRLTLRPGEDARLLFLLGEGDATEGARMREKYTRARADADFIRLGEFWDKRLGCLQIQTPNEDMNTEINIWNLYQSEINVMFSRFTSFIEVGGRVGLGFRDTAQDAMCNPHADEAGCRGRIVDLLCALTGEGYGLHLFQPKPRGTVKTEEHLSITVIPEEDKKTKIHGIRDACADDALWLVSAVVQYIRETGDTGFCEEVLPYAGEEESGTVYGHLKRILDFSCRETGRNGICKGLRADWNDCLNLGGGESAMVSFLLYWALGNFISLAKELGRQEDAEKYAAAAESVRETAERVLWDGEWYLRGITKNGRPIGTAGDAEGRVHMESNTWAVVSGLASRERAEKCMDSVEKYLYTPYGLLLNAPSYTKCDPDIGVVTMVYPGLKENGSVFSHPNPWAWCAEALLGHGTRAMKYYDALCPARQNDMIEIRRSEPYAYCQFISGRDHACFGEAHHPFMTGSSGWAYFAATQYILGVRPAFDGLIVDPCIPAAWKGFSMKRMFRGALYEITVENPDGAEKGVKELYVNGVRADRVPVVPAGETCRVRAVMGV